LEIFPNLFASDEILHSSVKILDCLVGMFTEIACHSQGPIDLEEPLPATVKATSYTV